MTRRVYRGTNIEVSFDLDICIHVGACLLGAPEVFDRDRRPWILADNANADDVAEVVRRCPSGALQYRRLDGVADEQSPAPPTLRPVRNGPLAIRGDVEVSRPDGSVEHLPRATLCRCGLSNNKPFCDNSHLTAKFEAEGERWRIVASPVRPTPDQPISKEDDPRGRD
jgi:uncharacterized Fe-S cluster protein YjdI/CDGSH-type Zn-finger protein